MTLKKLRLFISYIYTLILIPILRAFRPLMWVPIIFLCYVWFVLQFIVVGLKWNSQTGNANKCKGNKYARIFLFLFFTEKGLFKCKECLCVQNFLIFYKELCVNTGVFVFFVSI